jgi:hypothetical protein
MNKIVNSVIEARRKELGPEVFPEGTTGAKCYKLNWEPVPSNYRPLLYYISIYILDLIVSLCLKWLGFEKRI